MRPMKFLMIVCVPKPIPVANAPPINAKTVSGIRAWFRTKIVSANRKRREIESGMREQVLNLLESLAADDFLSLPGAALHAFLQSAKWLSCQ